MFKKKVKILKTRKIIGLASFVLMVLLGVGSWFYHEERKKLEQVLEEKIKARQLTISRAGSLAISNFFEERKRDLLRLAADKNVQALDEERGRQVLKNLAENLKENLVLEIVRVDKEGKTAWSENVLGQKAEEGINVSDRDYFVWAKNQTKEGGIFLSQPIIARGGLRKGQLIVIMATPVFYKEKFNGLVFFSFFIKDLQRHFVSPLSFSTSNQILLLEEKGIIVASSIEGTEGKNIFGYEEKDGSNFKKYLLERKEVSFIHYYSFPETKGKKMKMIAAASPIKVNGNLWWLIISAPEEEVKQYIYHLEIWQMAGFIYGMVGLLILTILFIFSVRASQRDGFINGFHNGRNGIKRLKKN